jgi:hypothetical protein
VNQDLLDLAFGANRVLTYAGYVLLAGTLTFWSVVWPDGRRNRRLVVLAMAGTAAMIIGTVAGPAIQLIFGGKVLGDIVTPLGGAAQLVRLVRWRPLSSSYPTSSMVRWLGGVEPSHSLLWWSSPAPWWPSRTPSAATGR